MGRCTARRSTSTRREPAKNASRSSSQAIDLDTTPRAATRLERRGAPFKVRGLTYSHTGDVRALKGIDLEVKKGEYIAIRGAIGPGKQVAMQLIESLGQSHAFGDAVE